MSSEKQKDDKASSPKKVEGAEPSELDNESLDDVSGGLAPAIPNVGDVTGLPSREVATCLSQS
jgi:hypothetical protein